MSYSTKRNGNKSIIGRLSTEDNQYKTIKEYFSNIDSIAYVFSNFDEKEKNNIKEFKKFFSIINNHFDFSKNTKTLINGLFKKINPFKSLSYENDLGKILDYKKNKIIIQDLVLEKSYDTIFLLYLESFFDIKKKIKKEVWDYVFKQIAFFYNNKISESYFNHYFIEFTLENRSSDLEYYKKNKNLSETKYLEKEIDAIFSFSKKINLFEKIQNYNHKKPVTKNHLEKKLIKTIDYIVQYDFETIIDFLEIDYDCEFFYEDDVFQNIKSKKEKEIYAKKQIANIIYPSFFMIIDRENSFLEEEYLSWINEYFKNGLLQFYCYNEIVMSKEEIIFKNKIKRNKIKQIQESFLLFNKTVLEIKEKGNV